ncbi:MAG: 4Fe-4S dicluster domain-containing protein [Magnetospirillum sp. WYHS-4]
MAAKKNPAGEAVIVGLDGIDALVKALSREGYATLGPRVEAGAVVYGPVASAADLPGGWTDEQEGGHYRLKKSKSPALFDHVVGPHSWKRFLYPPVQTLWTAVRKGRGFILGDKVEAERMALVGVRPCELAAIAIHDKVFDNGQFTDSGYLLRRKGAFLVAVNCGRAAATCFCASMNTGPRASAGYDLALTELVDGKRHEFLVEAGSEKGARLLPKLKGRPAEDADRKAAAKRSDACAKSMTRTVPDDIGVVLKANPTHARWDEVAKRCLNCANCTMVCPTCFCTTVEDVTDLKGDSAERVRKWDSCFTVDFSYIHGGPIRRDAKARYRQWMIHKLSAWHDQFGTSGCVGCGRCITWCPVGIDITEEARAIRDSDGRA